MVPPFIEVGPIMVCLSIAFLRELLLSLLAFSVSADSLCRLVGTACGPDKSSGHSTVGLEVPDEFRFFGCSGEDFKCDSSSGFPKLEESGDWWGELVVGIEVEKFDAAADLAKDRRA